MDVYEAIRTRRSVRSSIAGPGRRLSTRARCHGGPEWSRALPSPDLRLVLSAPVAFGAMDGFLKAAGTSRVRATNDWPRRPQGYRLVQIRKGCC
jgi:hypothetical protein